MEEMKKKDLSFILIILSNLLILLSIFIFKWNVRDIIVLYFIEVFIISVLEMVEILTLKYKNTAYPDNSFGLDMYAYGLFIFLKNFFIVLVLYSFARYLFKTNTSMDSPNYSKAPLSEMFRGKFLNTLLILIAQVTTTINEHFIKKSRYQISPRKYVETRMFKFLIILGFLIIAVSITTLINLDYSAISIFLIIIIKTILDINFHKKIHLNTD